MSGTQITVMVTGIGGGGHGEQILKALNLADTNYRIIGADMSPVSKGLVDVDVAVQLPPASSPHYITELLKACTEYDVKALFHGSEPELKMMAKNRDLIEAQGVFLPINPDSVIELCMDKFKTMEFLRTHGFKVPRYERVCSNQDLSKVDFYPAVLKPSIGAGGSADVTIAQNEEEVIVLGGMLLNNCGEFIAQEYVGTPDSEYTVGVVLGMGGELINSIAVKRSIMSALSNRIKVPNRTNRKDLGTVLAISSGVSQGQIGRFPEVTKPCEIIAKHLGAKGAINIQCRIHNGELYVFEINPRFSGTTSLRAMVGYNEPDILIRQELLKAYVETGFGYHEGVIARGLSETFFESNV